MRTFAIWYNRQVIGYCQMTQEMADKLNNIVAFELYFGFDSTTSPEKYENQ